MLRRRIKPRSRSFELKLIGYEDILVGIALGILMIAYSGLFFTIPSIDIVLQITLWVFIVLAVFDIFHEIKTMAQDFFFTILALISNVIEIFISLVFISKINIAIPLVNNFVHYLENPIYILIAGLFLVLANIFWFYAYHFMK